MYTSYIGKKFLKLYNKKEQKNLSARQFFDEVMFPLFFNSEKHLMHVSNSPFFQKPSQKALEGGLTKSQAQLAKLHQDILSQPPNMAIYVGYAAKDVDGTTSGQITDMKYDIGADEMYSSWIGEGLGIGVSGGYIMLIDNDKALSSLFAGWKHYREFLSQTPNLKDKQIETWNGHWLSHVFDKKFNPDDVLDGLKIEVSEVQGNIAIPTKSWSEVIFSLTKQFPNQDLIAYAYNLSQTNTTLGFVKLYLPEIRRLYELRDKLFIDESKTILKNREIEQLETFYNFKNACKIGTIGLKSLEPKGLRTFMPIGTYQYAQGKSFNFKKETSLYNFSIIKLWVIAMLNKTELLELASEVANSILDYEKESKPESRGKTTTNREAIKILESKSVKNFIDSLTESIVKQPNNAKVFKQVVKEILIMPVDNFPLFVTLIKFEYYFQKSSQEKK